MKLNAQTLKAIGAAIIVCAAFAIMLPGFVSYALSLSRVIILIVTVLAVAVVLGQIYARTVRKRSSAPVAEAEHPAVDRTAASDTTLES